MFAQAPRDNSQKALTIPEQARGCSSLGRPPSSTDVPKGSQHPRPRSAELEGSCQKEPGLTHTRINAPHAGECGLIQDVRQSGPFSN